MKRALSLLLCVACQKPLPTEALEQKEAAPPPPPAAEAPPPTEACIATATAEGVGFEHKIGGLQWVQSGAFLRLRSVKPGTKQLSIGVVADIKDAGEGNLRNLRAFKAWFDAEKVDVVVVAGDTGITKEDIVAAVSVVAAVPVPIFVLIGNREGVPTYKAALRDLTARFPNVFDLGEIRSVHTPFATLVSLPGYFNPTYMHAEQGCLYKEEHFIELTQLAQAATSPVVLISHGGPKQDGAEGLDRTAEGGNVGDPRLARFIAESKIPFGIFANIHEAGGRGVDRLGNTRLAPGALHDELLLNAGPVDSVRWVMNDGTESLGMAAILTVTEGRKAKYQIQRAKGGS